MLFRGSEHVQLNPCPRNLTAQSQSPRVPPWRRAARHRLLSPLCSCPPPGCWPCREQPESQHRVDAPSWFYSILIEFRSWKPKSQPQVTKIFSVTSRKDFPGHRWFTAVAENAWWKVPSRHHPSDLFFLWLDGSVLRGFFWLPSPLTTNPQPHSIFSKTSPLPCNSAEPRYPKWAFLASRAQRASQK